MSSSRSTNAARCARMKSARATQNDRALGPIASFMEKSVRDFSISSGSKAKGRPEPMRSTFCSKEHRLAIGRPDLDERVVAGIAQAEFQQLGPHGDVGRGADADHAQYAPLEIGRGFDRIIAPDLVQHGGVVVVTVDRVVGDDAEIELGVEDRERKRGEIQRADLELAEASAVICVGDDV